MKILHYLLLGVVLCLVACNDDGENVSPSGETNWFVLEDSEDELDHLAYLIYDETGIPIYYNDTIARIKVGEFPGGEPIYRYEVLAVNYKVTGHTGHKYPLLKEREQIGEGMEFLRDEVIPELLNNMTPCSYLLVESFVLNHGSVKEQRDVYKARRTTCVAWEEGMTEDEKKEKAARVLAEEYASYLSELEVELETLTTFYMVSRGKVNNRDDQSLYGQPLKSTQKGTVWDENWETFGFLDYDHAYTYEAKKEYRTPIQERDIADYVKWILMGDDEAFKTKYEEFPLCIKKYDIMKEIVTDLQVTLGKRLKK